MLEKNGVRGSSHSAWMTILLTVVACAPAAEDTIDPKQRPAEATLAAPIAAPPSYQDLADATFTGILDQPVRLVDGLWEGEPFDEGGASRPRVGLTEDFLLEGDLTGDGNAESVVLLWTSSGGSGTFDYIAAAGRQGQAVSVLGTAELGDRIQIRQGRIVDGRIELDVVQGGPDDAACCPSQLATRTWTLVPGGLAEGQAEITGTLSTAALQGTEWRLAAFSRDEKAPDEPEVTLTFDEGRVAGSSGCNRYFANIDESVGGPGSLSIGHMGGTRMMCPEAFMAVEDRFLEQLAGADSYGFLTGKLVLNFHLDDQYDAMIFTPAKP
jgi:heat shock protein HslJ